MEVKRWLKSTLNAQSACAVAYNSILYEVPNPAKTSYFCLLFSMRSIALPLLLCLLYGGATIKAQSGSYFSVGLQYNQTERPGMDAYFAQLSDSLQISDPVDLKGGFGGDFHFLLGGEHAEFSIGVGLYTANSYTGDIDTNLLHVHAKEIPISIGLNYLPVSWFIAGGRIFAKASEYTLDTESNPKITLYTESLPSTDLNIFRGYSTGIRAHAGFNFAVNEDETAFLRILPYYQLSLTKFNFYDVMEPHLKAYGGEQKSGYSGFGIDVSFVFGISEY